MHHSLAAYSISVSTLTCWSCRSASLPRWASRTGRAGATCRHRRTPWSWPSGGGSGSTARTRSARQPNSPAGCRRPPQRTGSWRGTGPTWRSARAAARRSGPWGRPRPPCRSRRSPPLASSPWPGSRRCSRRRLPGEPCSCAPPCCASPRRAGSPASSRATSSSSLPGLLACLQVTSRVSGGRGSCGFVDGACGLRELWLFFFDRDSLFPFAQTERAFSDR